MDRNVVILENIPIKLDLPALAVKLRIREGQDKFVKKLHGMAQTIIDMARPKAIAKLCPVRTIDDNHVEVDGITLTSPLLREKTASLGRVFAFVATEGLELAHWAETLDSSLDMVFAGVLREAVTKQYQALLEEKILEKFGLAQVSCMNPGSLPIWPLTQQTELFKVLAPYPEKLGVRLLPSCLMYPAYTVDGIYFQTSKKYYNCQLCPRENCPNRKAPSTVI